MNSLFDRAHSKYTELLAKVFDHCSMKYKRGYRMLTLDWSDGNSFVPVNHCLLSAADDKKLLCESKHYDGRSLAGILAKYVLFDRWFSFLKSILAIKKELHLDTIAMIKKSSKIKYRYNGESLDIKKICSMNRKRREKSKYLFSIKVIVGK